MTGQAHIKPTSARELTTPMDRPAKLIFFLDRYTAKATAPTMTRAKPRNSSHAVLGQVLHAPFSRYEPTLQTTGRDAGNGEGGGGEDLVSLFGNGLRA